MDSIARDHDRAFHARFAILRDVTVQYRWGGKLCLSRNNVGVVGELEDALFSACCQNGLGIARETFTGILAEEMATNMLARALVCDPAKKLPARILTRIDANPYLQWQEKGLAPNFNPVLIARALNLHLLCCSARDQQRGMLSDFATLYAYLVKLLV